MCKLQLNWRALERERHAQRSLNFSIRCYIFASTIVQRKFGLCILTIYSVYLRWNSTNSLSAGESCSFACFRVSHLCAAIFETKFPEVCVVQPDAYRRKHRVLRQLQSTLKHIIIQELNIIVALVINYTQTKFHYIQMQFDIHGDRFALSHVGAAMHALPSMQVACVSPVMMMVFLCVCNGVSV